MTDKPRWLARDDRDREAMVRWAHERLDELQAAELRPKGNATAHAAWLKADGPEIEAAEWGDIGPLRKKYPHLAPFLFAPPPSKIKKPTKATKDDAIAAAVWAYQRIPQIWQREYGRKNRRIGQAGALEIAARWADVDESDILRRMKPSGRSGKSRAD